MNTDIRSMIARLDTLNEARDPNLPYDEKRVKDKIKSVTVTLQGNQSGAFTKMLRQYERIERGLDVLTAKRKELNPLVREQGEALFDAEDAVYTRIVETVSATLNLSARSVPQPKETTDYQAVVNALLETMPELEEAINSLIKVHTTISTPEARAAGVKVSRATPTVAKPVRKKKVGESVEGGNKLQEYLNRVNVIVTRWAQNYDRALARINARIENL